MPHDYKVQEVRDEQWTQLERWELWDGDDMLDPVVSVCAWHPLAEKIIEYVKKLAGVE